MVNHGSLARAGKVKRYNTPKVVPDPHKKQKKQG